MSSGHCLGGCNPSCVPESLEYSRRKKYIEDGKAKMEHLGKPENRDFQQRAHELPASRAAEKQIPGSLKLVKVIQMRSIRPLPLVPKFVKGVIDFRGKTIPVVDLRIALGLKPRDYTAETLVAVVDAVTVPGTVRMGLVLDAIFGLEETKLSHSIE